MDGRKRNKRSGRIKRRSGRSKRRIRSRKAGECAKTSGCACPGVKCMVKRKCRGKTKCPWSKSRMAKYNKKSM